MRAVFATTSPLTRKAGFTGVHGTISSGAAERSSARNQGQTYSISTALSTGKYHELEIELGRPVTYDEFRIYTDPIEKEFDIGQISPRIFEYAVMRTPMILFRGRYSGIIEPDTHYIPLEKDFSNVDQVLKRLNDLPALEAMAARAYEHLVASGRFGYRSFAQMLESEFVKRYDSLAASRPSGSEAPVIEPKPAQAPSADIFIDRLRDEVLRERPTPLPHFLSDFQHKQRLLALLEELRKQIIFDELTLKARIEAHDSLKAFIDRIPIIRTLARFTSRVFIGRISTSGN